MARPKGSKNKPRLASSDGIATAGDDPDDWPVTVAEVDEMVEPGEAATEALAEKPAKAARGRPRKIGVSISIPAASTNGPSAVELQNWLNEYMVLEREAATIRQKQGAVKKELEGSGGVWRAFKSIFAAAKLTHGEATAALRSVIEYHQAINIQVSWDAAGQGGFDVVLNTTPPEPGAPKEAADRLAAARANSDGWNSGKNGGLPHDCPFNAGTLEFVEWHRGRDDGQADKTARTTGMKDRLAAGAALSPKMPDEALF